MNLPTLATLARHSCPVCHSQESTLLCTVEAFHVQACGRCHCDFVANPPTERELAAYYDRRDWFEGGERGGYENYDRQTEGTVASFDILLDQFQDSGLSLLDVGCGYGNHLAAAVARGWKCFGIEPSAHAREVAMARLGSKATVVASADDLIPHEFDLIVMFDVIEHATDPYQIFFSLFSAGAIAPKTRIVLTTPNARSTEAMTDAAGWRYMHPPSHLVFYSGKGLATLLRRLRFRNIAVRGIHAATDITDDSEDWPACEGLSVEADGSDFAHFMQERYVPGTWSEIAAYEHLPRYQLARQFATGRRVLDFGCGTGYGTSALAEVATSVVGLDIDESALDWARNTHAGENIQFVRHDDFGASLPAQSFDLITCFEMIEHVAHEDQIKAVDNLARLLAADGILVMSTPNPEVTCLYGENPYHLREMTRGEFLELLHSRFENIQLLDQRVLTGILFSDIWPDSCHLSTLAGQNIESLPAMAYLAICSHGQGTKSVPAVYLDASRDYIRRQLHDRQQLNHIRLADYQTREQALDLATHLDASSKALEAAEAELSASRQQLVRQAARIEEQGQQINKLEEHIENQGQQIENHVRDLSLMRQSHWYRLGVSLKRAPRSLRALLQTFYLIGALLLPARLKPLLAPLVAPLRRRALATDPADLSLSHEPYRVRQPITFAPQRPKVLHAIANFCTGGSSRLVVDLMEQLGGRYEQRIITSHIPSPPAYLDIEIAEFPNPASFALLMDYLARLAPDFVHIHYWGDCDESWYRMVFRAAEQMGLPVIQNINTPIAPHVSPAIVRNVYVSEYVRATFSPEDPLAIVIHPGSDFSRFCRDPIDELPPDDYVGMVYRLENDKLNEQAIDVFIKLVRRRPATRCLIVGGGSLLEGFRQATQQAGVASAFEFTGYVAYEDLPALYRRMAVFIAPVWKESFGQVTPFAMNMGIPVAGYRVGALSEIVDDSSLLAPAGDSDSLADILVQLLDDRPRRLRIGERNRQRARENFSLESMVDAYTRVYGETTRQGMS